MQKYSKKKTTESRLRVVDFTSLLSQHKWSKYFEKSKLEGASKKCGRSQASLIIFLIMQKYSKKKTAQSRLRMVDFTSLLSQHKWSKCFEKSKL
jgi:hypothetical protein